METRIIYLPSNPLSKGLANDAFSSATELGITPKMIPGITEKEVPLYFQEHNLKLAPNSNITWNRATMGCFASHHKLWRECVDTNTPILIMEHDGILIRDPGPLVGNVEHVCHLDRFVPFDSRRDETDNSHREEYERNVEKNHGEGVIEYPSYIFYGKRDVTGDCFVQAYGYIVTPEGAKRLIAFADEKGVFPADKAICRNAVRLQRSVSTYVKYHPFYDTMEKQRTLTTRR